MSLAEAVAQRPLKIPPVRASTRRMPPSRSATSGSERKARRSSHCSTRALAGERSNGRPNVTGRWQNNCCRDGLKSLINFGPGEEDLAHAVEAASGGAAETFTGSLTQLIALTRRARLFIGGDTGPMHLAAALGVPVVAIFGPTDPARNGPFGTRSHRVAQFVQQHQLQHVFQPDEACLKSAPGKWLPRRGSCWRSVMASWSAIARRVRVPLGFVFAILYFWLAKPTVQSILIGAALVIPGLIDSSAGFRPVAEKRTTRDRGLYAYTRNPLYLGSLILSIGFALASRSWWIVGGIIVLVLCHLSSGDSCRGRISARALPGVRRLCPPGASLIPSSERIWQEQRSVQLGPVLEAPRVQRQRWEQQRCWRRWWPKCCYGTERLCLVCCESDAHCPTQNLVTHDVRPHCLLLRQQSLALVRVPADRNSIRRTTFTSCA